MGLLAEGKTRRKINKDPNNTKWTRDETTFGQKILRAQGWQPGEYLGAQNSSHSELHTAANASYIRVVLKDDMKGLGFNRAKEDEVTGLDVFQDLLSRLNGKSDEAIDEERGARLAVKTNYYVEQRYGPMRFVRGGFLVGDEMKKLTIDDSSSEAESKTNDADAMEVESVQKKSKKEKKSKKRKAVDEDDAVDRASEAKSKKRRKEEHKSKESSDLDDAKAKKKDKKTKKSKSRSKKDSEKSTEVSDDDAAQTDEPHKKRKSKKDSSQPPEDSGEDKFKDFKKSKKEKKDKKRRRAEEAEASGSAGTPTATVLSPAGTGTSTPTETGTLTPQGSRNFVRSRFIAQKRQAVLDTKALAQIFMVKA